MTVFIYYASSDLRMHVAVSTIEKLSDCVINTPEDGFTSHTSIHTIRNIIQKKLQAEEDSKNFEPNMMSGNHK